ncbi:MAG TPA: lipase family protein, partial [Acidimicrobiales bacterium]
EGLGTPGPHPFLVGESAGRSVLDAALAVRQLPNAGAGDRLAIYGVSQGGHAALWAGQLASSWAPELDVVGVVAAAPFSEVDVLLPAASTIPGGEGYLVLGVYGQAAANPELDPEAVLDPAVVAQANVVEERCTPDVHAVFRQVAVDLGGPIAKLDALAGPDWSAQLASIKPGTTRIDVPVLIVQGERDTTIPAATTRILVSRMCANATSVGTVYKDAGHSEVVVAADREIRDWLTARLTGEPATSSCGSGG